MIAPGFIGVLAVGLRPAEITAPPDKLYLQSPERYEFIDITDLSKRYVISLATGLYVPFSGVGGGTGITSLAAANDFATAALDTSNVPIANALLNKVSAAIPWAASAGGGTPHLASGTSPGVNTSFLNTTVGTTALSPAIDGITQVLEGDVIQWQPAATQFLLISKKPTGLTMADLSDGTSTLAAVSAIQGALNVQSVATKTSDYTLVFSDAGTDVDMSSASAMALTVPLNSSVPFPLGTLITITQTGVGTVTMTPAVGVSFQKPTARSLAISAQYESCSLYKVGTDTWRVLCG